MTASPASWQLTLARMEGALPLLTRTEATLLARRSLRRLWAHHVRAYPFENLGPDHDPGPDAAELVRTHHTAERDAFCSWIARRAAPPLAEAATSVLTAKGVPETFESTYEAADSALDRCERAKKTALPAHSAALM